VWGCDENDFLATLKWKTPALLILVKISTVVMRGAFAPLREKRLTA
jgi:hypothetical protein